MVTGRYSRLLRSGTDEMTHFHTKRNRRRRALEYGSKQMKYAQAWLNSNKLRVNQISKMHDRIIQAYKSRQRFYLPPQAPFCGVLADSHASFIYGKTLEYMTDALESTPAGVYGGGCSLDDFA